jgi:hypothetical protein
MTSLRQWNSVAAVIHFSQAVLMLVILEGSNFGLSFTRLEFDEQAETLTPVAEFLDIEFEVGLLVVAFLFLSALAHTTIATVLYGRYKDHLANGMNPYRWYEYSISASVMIVVIAALSGIADIGVLLSLFALTALMNLFGLLMEEQNNVLSDDPLRRQDWRPFVYGCFAGIAPWVVIMITTGATYAEFPDEFPLFVLGATGVTFLFFNTFAVNMYLQYKKIGPWSEYLFGERVYIALSLLAKSALAWWVYWGVENAPIVAG